MMMFQTHSDPEQPKKQKKKKQSERPDSSGMLYFILAFVVCLALFAGIGVLWWKIAKPELPYLNPDASATTTTTSAEPTKPTSRFAATDRFSIAVYITDDRGALQSVSLCLFKPDSDSISVIALPAELGLPDADTDTLSRRFATGGPESAQMALSGYIGKPVDYYAALTYSGVEKYLTALEEPLIVKLPKDIDQQASDGSFSIHLKEGEQALSPKQVANLLRCDNWQSGRRERTNMHAAVVSAYINQFVSEGRDLTADHTQLSVNANTNLNNSRFKTIITPLSYLAELRKDLLCTSTHIDGTFTGAGSTLRFTPGPGVIDTIKSNMK
ncbi:MAG: hypothetical protein E7553_07725 [Ruminococcaceae bacterium]|nr:hypothetical protein [Oscillospiraceae bacterium]